MTEEQAQVLPTLDEAVRKAKADFVRIVSTRKELKLGVDSATLEQSQSAAPIHRVEVDIKKLLTADSTASLAALAGGDVSTVVPLERGDTVITIVELAREEGGWRVIGIAGVGIASDLNRVRRALRGQTPDTVTLYDVPNIEAHVYAVLQGGRELLFTSYGRFTLDGGVTAAVLVPVLKADAVEFQRQYGDSLPQQRLVR